uniref:PI-PLC Y-box domain-containing protein n=1 Tax=viral metagenome TaxID=1070528 RepID=A0A6C0DFW5_9ZZZZ
MVQIKHALMVLGIIIVVIVIYYLSKLAAAYETFDNPDFKSEPEYKAQIALLSKKFSSTADAKRPVSDLLSTIDMPPVQQNFVNFYALACRYPGYIGPMNEGYVDPDIGIQNAVQAGCRVFVLDIDYLDDCTEAATKYFPRLVVRDSQGKIVMKYSGNLPFCNTESSSNLAIICEKINFYAFASSCQQASDPVVIVLYFVRQPPGSYKSQTVLDYYSHVAKAMKPFKDRILTNELNGGTFYRQKQENRLLINKITDYNGKVLIFSNANTSGFRENQTYSPMEDLDYLVNLRLSYTQTQLGVTSNDSGSSFGILQTVEDYTVVPPDRADEVVEHTKLKWTICLSKDPLAPVSSKVYQEITKTFGVNCVPAILFDPMSNDFLFSDSLFKTYGFQPKPEPLRYIKPPVVTPAQPNPSTDAKQGMLRSPVSSA